VITLSLLHPVKQTPVQVWTFPNESVIRIGRSTENQVVLYSAVVSRHHVELRRMGSAIEVVNLGTNGTYVDGKRITQSMMTEGATIRLARSGPMIQIQMGEAAATVAVAVNGTNDDDEIASHHPTDIGDLEEIIEEDEEALVEL
jgi:pSer/pThr/pTyr-binding forkhead associated (FHA) protein